MKIKITFAYAVILACGVLWCASAQDSGRAFSISLEGNPTTGFEWNCSGGEGIVEATGRTYNKESSGRSGAGGVYIFTFKGIKSGEAVLTFTYSRPWEKDTAPAETRRYLLKVDEQKRIFYCGELSRKE